MQQTPWDVVHRARHAPVWQRQVSHQILAEQAENAVLAAGGSQGEADAAGGATREAVANGVHTLCSACATLPAVCTRMALAALHSVRGGCALLEFAG